MVTQNLTVIMVDVRQRNWLWRPNLVHPCTWTIVVVHPWNILIHPRTN